MDNELQPTNPAPVTLALRITYASCHGHVSDSEDYRLVLNARASSKKIKSPYIEGPACAWGHPFGDDFCFVSDAQGAQFSISLRRHRFGRSGDDLATWGLDFTALRGSLGDPMKLHSGEWELCLNGSVLDVTGDPIVKGLTLNGTTQGPSESQRDSWTVLFDRLTRLLGIAHQVAEISPWAKLAWGVVFIQFEVISEQIKRYDKMKRLVNAMAQACEFPDSARALRTSSDKKDNIIKILQQVTQCAYFVEGYCRDSRFRKEASKHIVSGADAQIADYISSLEALHSSLVADAASQCPVMVYRVLDHVKETRRAISDIDARQVLDKMKYAPEAHHSLDDSDICLPGTRVEIIDAIVHWAARSASAFPGIQQNKWCDLNLDARVLWLCGVSGTGKSTIIRSVARRLQELGRLGAFYSFSDATRNATNPATLFSTIARDLVERDHPRKAYLVQHIKDDASIQTTTDCRLQFRHFIIEPFNDLPTVGDTVVVIDAFDECGSVEARQNLLGILTKRAQSLPSGFRFLVTSRYKRDVQEAIGTQLPSGVELFHLESVPPELTSRDIRNYINSTLQQECSLVRLNSEKKRLASNAEQSFQWASTACQFILRDVGDNARSSPRQRLSQLLSPHSTLDHLYKHILSQKFPGTRADTPVHHILGLLVCAGEPLSLRSMVGIAHGVALPAGSDLQKYQRVGRYLAPLISGSENVDTPIKPLHTSFADFLRDTFRSGDFAVDTSFYARFLVLQCLSVLKDGLRFNLCGIPTSFRRNVDFSARISSTFQEQPSLSYACRFWTRHVAQHMRENQAEETIMTALSALLNARALEWLEAMSLLGHSPHNALLELSDTADSLGSLQPKIRDLTRFTSMFALPISESAPHIYLSAVPFLPRSFSIEGVCQQSPSTVRLKQGRLYQWPALLQTMRCGSDIFTIAFSPDGSRIASGSGNEIYLWDASTGAAIGEPMHGHTGSVRSVAFSPSGEHIASGSDDKTIRLWVASTGDAANHPINGHKGAVLSVVFSPSGKHIASGSGDCTVRLWDMSTGIAIGEPMRGHTGRVRSVAFSSGGNRIASGSDDHTVRLWDASIGAAIGKPLAGHVAGVRSVAFSTTGECVVSGSADETLRLWNATTGTAIGESMRGHTGSVNAVAFSRTGERVASGSSDETVRLWDASTGAAIGEPLRGHTGSVDSLEFSPSNERIASGSSDHTACLWDVSMSPAIDEPANGHTDTVSSVAFSPNGERIASGSDDATVRLWDVSTGAAVGEPMRGHTRSVQSIAFSPRGERLASCSLDSTVCLWDASTGNSIGELMRGHTYSVCSVTFSPNGAYIVTGSDDKTIRLWDASTGAAIREPMRGHTGHVWSVACSPSGKHIASGSSDYTVRVWDASRSAAIGEPMCGHSYVVWSVAFSPNGQYIASGSGDRTIRLWDVSTGDAIGVPMRGHTDWVRSVSFSPNGEHIASGSADGTVRMWDTSTGTALGEPMRGYTGGAVLSVAFSPVGERIASGSSNRTIRVWDLVGKEASNSTGAGDPRPGDSGLQRWGSFFSQDNVIPDDGWILGKNNDLLLWIPPSYRDGLSISVPGSRVFGGAHTAELDLTDYKCGEEWTRCRDQPLASEQ